MNATGFRPDLDILREIRLELDEIVEAPKRLAPLIDPNVHSCGTVEPHGFRELTHPEQGFFIVGMKSYGRAPTFLLATGYEQVRSVTAWLAGDTASASKVELVLPATGVCSTDVERRRRMLLVIRIREMTAADWPAVERIYAQGIEDGEATFETADPVLGGVRRGQAPGPATRRRRRRRTRRRMGRGIRRLRPPRVPRRGRALGLHRPRRARATGSADFCSTPSSRPPRTRDLDDPVEHLPRERREPEAPRGRRLPRRRPPRTDRHGPALGPHAGQWRDTS